MAALGLIVLRVDETIEQEFRHFVPADTKLYVTRIQSGDDLTPASIAGMEQRLTEAASLLPAAAGFDVVGYACTSGTALLGAENVAQRVMDGVPTRWVTNPFTAAVAQLQDLGVRTIGLVSPYILEVAETLNSEFEAHGFVVAHSVTMNEVEEAKVSRIEPQVICNAARACAENGPCDALFLSCTNLRTQDLLGPLSRELGMPVVSSNSALAWHMQRLSQTLNT